MGDASAVLAHASASALAFLPNVVIALVIVAVGWLVAIVVDRLVVTMLTRLGFDRVGQQSGMIDDFERIGLRVGPSRLVGKLAFWVIVANAAVQAIKALQLAEVSTSLGAFVTFLPHVVIAVAIVLAGIVVGDVTGRNTSRVMVRSGINYHDVTGTVVRAAIIVIAVLMALQQLTIESTFFFDLFLVAFASVAVAVTLACGLGGRDVVENAFAGRYVERSFELEDRITMGTVRGSIERFDTLSTVVRASDGRRVVIPNRMLASAVVEVEPVVEGTVDRS